MMKKKLSVLMGALVAVASFVVTMGSAVASPSIPWRTPTYTLLAREMPLREAFDAFAVAQGMSVVMSKSVDGVFSGDFRQMPAQEFLERVCTIHNLTWYFDGAALYIYTAGEIMTTLTDLAYMKVENVIALLTELGVVDERFPIKTASNGEIILVSGPPRYVQLILQTIERADRLKQLRTFNEIETRIFPLKNTWADTVGLNVTGPESAVSIRGVAQLLQEIMSVTADSLPNVREADSNRTDEVEARVRDRMNTSFSPIIRPENRLNAVIVRDSVVRMPMYERLISELDRPQKLVEVAVTTLDMSRRDALDWQLSVQAHGGKDRVTAGAGQNVQNLFEPDGLSGKGLSGSITYLGRYVDITASLTALREKGKMRNISRTALLTLNNMAAELTDRQSYHARVVGREVASLESVTAGTRLGIKPRIVESSDTNMPRQVWMTMVLEDGGFESATVDAMPMTRTTSLETQAALYEGHSLLLAGYLRDVESEAGWGIPYLRDLPFIGWLFGGSSRQSETVQRLFVLTPRVIELTTDEIVRYQAARNRDIGAEEALERDFKADDNAKEERRLKRFERETIRREETDDRITREKGEIEFRKEQREAEREKEMRKWRDDLETRRGQWKESVR